MKVLSEANQNDTNLRICVPTDFDFSLCCCILFSYSEFFTPWLVHMKSIVLS